MKKKYLIALFALIILILFGYWLKCQMGINFSELYSLSDSIPFKYLKRNNVIATPEPGILLDDPFESSPVFSNWSKLCMRKESRVTPGCDKNGIDNTSFSFYTFAIPALCNVLPITPGSTENNKKINLCDLCASAVK